MQQTEQSIKEKIMLIEQKLELYKQHDKAKCPVVTIRLEKELDKLYEELFLNAEVKFKT